MNYYEIKRGDYHRRLALTLEGVDTVGATSVTFRMRNKKTNTLVFSASGSIDSSTQISYQFVAPQLDVAGSFQLEASLQYADGRETVPTSGFVSVSINETLG